MKGPTPIFVREPELVDAICSGLELGLPVSVTLETASIRKHTFQGWMTKGRRHMEAGRHGDEDECDECTEKRDCERYSHYVSFRSRVLRARANGCVDLLSQIRSKAQAEKSGK